MHVADLPAVKDAVSQGGIFTNAVRKEEGVTIASLGRILIQLVVGFVGGWISAIAGLVLGVSLGFYEPIGFILLGFVAGAYYAGSFAKKSLLPNVQLAKKILQTGTIPLDKIGPALHAREPSEREQLEITHATRQLAVSEKFFFDRWFVLPSSHPYAITFGSYLFLSRGAIEQGMLDKVIAHELGHLNHGDSFVKCALWALGKGWTSEAMSLVGKVTEVDTDKHHQLGSLGSIGSALVRKQWEVAALEATLLSIVTTGGSLRELEEDIRAYFWKWDVVADQFAETLIPSTGYQTYLKDLANFEMGVGTMPLSAPAELRYDRSLARS